MTAPFDLDETDRLLSTTRAVRRRLDLDRPVERDVILDCIRLSQQAPTASNSIKPKRRFPKRMCKPIASMTPPVGCSITWGRRRCW